MTLQEVFDGAWRVGTRQGLFSCEQATSLVVLVVREAYIARFKMDRVDARLASDLL